MLVMSTPSCAGSEAQGTARDAEMCVEHAVSVAFAADDMPLSVSCVLL
jgi:hypothetical protein